MINNFVHMVVMPAIPICTANLKSIFFCFRSPCSRDFSFLGFCFFPICFLAALGCVAVVLLQTLFFTKLTFSFLFFSRFPLSTTREKIKKRSQIKERKKVTAPPLWVKMYLVVVLVLTSMFYLLYFSIRIELR